MDTPRSYEDPVEQEFDTWAKLIREEVEAVLEVLPQAVARQWSASPVPRPREDTHQRASGVAPPDPTADAALDPRRLAVRHTIKEATEVLRRTAINVRGVRRAMERKIEWYDGEDR